VYFKTLRLWHCRESERKAHYVTRLPDRVKLIFWDGTGMVLVSKRLEDGKFRWPGVADAIMRLSAAELQALLEGLDWRRVHEPRQTVVPVATS